MSIKAKSIAKTFRLDRTLAALLARREVPDAQIIELGSGLFEEQYWISYANYKALQSSLRESPQGSSAQHGRAGTLERAVVRMKSAPYQVYLRSLEARRATRRLPVPWVVDHIPRTTLHKRRPGERMTPEYLTIHSTGNPTSKANGERSWLTNAQNDRTASFHIVVDETMAVECIPFNEVAWHAGDGNGNGNKKSISIEICESGNRGKVLHNAILLAARILREADMTADKLRRHHDWATKMCPRILIVSENRGHPSQTWDWFTSEVEALL